ncbi:MAG TPA: isoprenyl transferase [Thermoanaerobaculaceae bacterium]|nr:isoprenyl transferase [Thermoanaerobaculaceae bacterium]HPS77556.1 isoprenyl transferase [Thermoanaerobaculaceae bacterium]
MKELDRLAPPGTPERAILEGLDLTRLPRHVAIIMDGNGRWARQRGLPRVEGHRAGIKTVREVAETAARLELGVLTIYAFSTENWKRPSWEVRTLMGLLREYLQREIDVLIENGIRLRPIGQLEALDEDIQQGLARAVEATSRGQGLTLQIALNYSGRNEIQDVCRTAARLAARGDLAPEAIDEPWISSQLATAGSPDPDLLIRTSGEQRISNFLLWQIAYAELYFTPVLWPDFRARDLILAVADFARRERRFGGVGEGGARSVDGEG